MSSIAILGGDWEILFDDETVGGNAVAGLKMVRKAVASPTIITSNALYSAVAGAMDELNAMDDENPMFPVTPTAYRMENGYFIPRSSTEFLTGGAIESNGWDGEIRSIAYTATVADFVAGDVGRQVTGGTTGDTGTLLDFEVLPDGTLLAWIRPDTASDTFDNASETLTVTGDGGTGNCTSTAISTTGESLYSNIQAIGSVPTATEVYLIQDRVKMTDSTGSFQWWVTDATLSLGIIDILVRVKRDDTLVADGDVELFSRRYTALYDNFRLNVAAGGRSAIPLASAPDINNTTGIRTFTGSSGVSDFDVGNGLYVGASWSAATKRGVVTAVGGTAVAPVISYYLVGDLTDFANLDSVQEYDFTTALDGDGSCTAAAPSNVSGGPADTSSGEGGTVTVNFGDYNVDHDGDGTSEPYSVQIDCQSNVPIAKVYERIKYLCRRGSGDPFNTPIGIDGEQWRGLSLQVSVDNAATDPIGDGEAIDVAATGWTGNCVRNNLTATINYITITDDQTSLDSLSDNDVIRQTDTPGNTALVDTGAGGGYAVISFTSPKSSPFGTFTGTQIFGARGVVYINPHSSDTQAYILTDDDGSLRTPPNTVSVTITGVDPWDTDGVGDRVLVTRDTGTAGVIDKDQNGGLAAGNNLGDADLAVASTIDSETPSSGVLRVVDVGNQDEQRYHYSSFSGTTFTFLHPAGFSGTATSGDIDTLTDSGASFITDGVLAGMLVYNTTQAEFVEIVEVVSETELTTESLSTGSWSGDAYDINSLVRAYGTDDNMYVPIIDGYAYASSIQNTLVKTPASNFGVVINVRQGGDILPFTQNNTVGDNGLTAAAIRTEDTIAT